MNSWPSTVSTAERGHAPIMEDLEAQALVWNQAAKLVNSMSLRCAIELGIADAIHSHGESMSLTDLVSALHVGPSRAPNLRRLMRVLVHSRCFAIDSHHRYTLTAASRLLLKDNPQSVAPLVTTVLDPAMTMSWNHLGRWFRSEEDATPFITAHGVGIWDHRRGDRSEYNRAMACDSRLVTEALFAARPDLFSGVERFVDVGGATGTFAKEVAAAFPGMECVVLDLPHVVEGLEGSKNLKFVGGDMFDAIPPADAILLKWIFPAFGDEECVKLLVQCRKSITTSNGNGSNRRGKVIIIDIVIDEDDDGSKDHDSVETKLCFDLRMMLYHNGKERNEKELSKLFSEAGFSDYNISPCLGLRSVIEVYP